MVYSTYWTGYPHQHRTRNGRICPTPQLASSNVLYSRCSWSQVAAAPNMPVLCAKSNHIYPWWIFSLKNVSLLPESLFQKKVSPPKFCIQFIMFSIWATHPVNNKFLYSSGVPGGGGVQPPPPPKFRRPSKIVPNSTRLWKMLKIPEFRTPTLHDVRGEGSKILKLLPVRNCFTLAMTNKLEFVT